MEDKDPTVSHPLSDEHSADEFDRDYYDNVLYQEMYDQVPPDAQEQLVEIKKWCDYFDVSFAELGDRELILNKVPWGQAVWIDEACGELFKMIGLDDPELWDEDNHLRLGMLMGVEEPPLDLTA